jgi:hypothetical protein
MSKGLEAVRQHIQEQFERVRQQPKVTDEQRLERLYLAAVRGLEKNDRQVGGGLMDNMIMTSPCSGDILAHMVDRNIDHKTQLIVEIFGTLSLRFKELNTVSYQAGWTDSFCHRRCMHEHPTLIEAAQCAEPHGAGWYVLAVEKGTPRQLRGGEEAVVNKFRFRKNYEAALGD